MDLDCLVNSLVKDEQETHSDAIAIDLEIQSTMKGVRESTYVTRKGRRPDS
jgi:hypothetical protein